MLVSEWLYRPRSLDFEIFGCTPTTWTMLRLVFRLPRAPWKNCATSTTLVVRVSGSQQDRELLEPSSASVRCLEEVEGGGDSDMKGWEVKDDEQLMRFQRQTTCWPSLADRRRADAKVDDDCDD